MDPFLWSILLLLKLYTIIFVLLEMISYLCITQNTNTMEKIKIDVVFRVDLSADFKGQVFAMFPHECGDFSGNVTSYQHVGQHGIADYKYCLRASKLATPEQYSDLKEELESIGYEVNIVKRQNYEKFLESYKASKRTILY